MPWKNNVTAQSKEKELSYFFQEICTRVKFGVVTWNPDNTPANSTLTTVLSAASYPQVTGLRVGMAVKVTPPATIAAGLLVDAYVAADDTLSVLLTNVTGVDIDMASTQWPFLGIVLS
jgi:hypothetical protein